VGVEVLWTQKTLYHVSSLKTLEYDPKSPKVANNHDDDDVANDHDDDDERSTKNCIEDK
jgi:hypothetical protein